MRLLGAPPPLVRGKEKETGRPQARPNLGLLKLGSLAIEYVSTFSVRPRASGARSLRQRGWPLGPRLRGDERWRGPLEHSNESAPSAVVPAERSEGRDPHARPADGSRRMGPACAGTNGRESPAHWGGFIDRGPPAAGGAADRDKESTTGGNGTRDHM